MPYISVIIPVYRVENYILRCVDSVANQSFKDFEIILVDDCGGDNSINTAVQHLNHVHPSVKYSVIRHDKNCGLSAARNTGVTNSNGEFIYFLDGDDSITENCLESLVNAINGDCDMVIANITKRGCDGDCDYTNYADQTLMTSDDIINAFISRKIAWNAVNRLIRKSFFIDHKIFFTPGLTSEDLLWNFETLPLLKKITTIRDFTYIYYTNPNSIMTSTANNLKYALDLIEIANKMAIAVNRHPSKPYIKYYLDIKYNLIPHAILWHGFPKKTFFSLYSQLLNNRFSDYFSHLCFSRKLTFLLPANAICRLRRFNYILSGYYDAIKHKLSSNQ